MFTDFNKNKKRLSFSFCFSCFLHACKLCIAVSVFIDDFLVLLLIKFGKLKVRHKFINNCPLAFLFSQSIVIVLQQSIQHFDDFEVFRQDFYIVLFLEFFGVQDRAHPHNF